MDKIKILVVDDDDLCITLITDILESEYTLIAATDGNEAVQKFESEAPDLILLDVNMPEMSGLEVCKIIREKDFQNNTAIVFVSGDDSAEECIKGYEVGGDDYIKKSFQANEFKNKIAAITRFQQSRKNLASKEAQARSVAFESMKEASQYGQVLQFLKASFSCDDIYTLSEEVFNSLENFGLNSCLQIRTHKETLSFMPNNRSCSPIEVELFEVLKSRGRLFNFGHRMMINDAHVSVLIKNMPVDDENLMGRLRDILAVIIEGFEARVMDLERKQAIESILSGLTTTMSMVNTQFKDHQHQTVSIMDNLIFNMGSSLHVLDLTEEQEQFFLKLVQKSMVELVSVCDSGKKIETEIAKVAALIKPLTSE